MDSDNHTNIPFCSFKALFSFILGHDSYKYFNVRGADFECLEGNSYLMAQ